MKTLIPDHSIQLFGIACLARNRARDSSRRSPESADPDSSVAVVMAAASAEGLMNELAEVCSPPFYEGPDATPTNLGKILDEIELSKGATTFKYLMASLLLSGAMFDRGGSPYQDLEMLFRVRNQYMHLPAQKRSDPAEGQPQPAMPKWVQTLQGRGFARKDPDGVLTWMAVVQTPEMAEWACRAASDAMIAVLDMLPMSIKNFLEWKGAILAHLNSTEIVP